MDAQALKEFVDRMRVLEEQNPHQAYKLAEELLKTGKRTKDQMMIAYGEYYLGESTFSIGGRENILGHALKALSLFKKSNDIRMICQSYNLAGIAYTDMDEKQLALQSFLKALEHSKESKEKINVLSYYNNIGVLYMSMRDYQEGLKYFRSTYKIHYQRKKTESYQLFNVNYNMADTYIKLGQPQKALKFIQDILDNGYENTVYNQDLSICSILSRAYYGMGKNQEGTEKYRELVSKLTLDYDAYELHADYEEIATIQMGLEMYPEAMHLIKFLEESANKTNLTMENLRVARLYILYAQKTGNLEMEKKWLVTYHQNARQKEEESRVNQLVLVKNKMQLSKDMEKLRREAQQVELLKLLSERDGLTGLMNRNSLNQLLINQLHEANKKSSTLGCLFLDMDGFKQYNDTYGHVEGDKCLKNIAEVLQGKESKEIHFARYGGDEFFGVLSGFTDDQLTKKGMEILEEVRKLNMVHEGIAEGKVSVSIGAFNSRVDEEITIIDYVNHADHALYHAKDSGKNMVVIMNQNKEYECFR